MPEPYMTHTRYYVQSRTPGNGFWHTTPHPYTTRDAAERAATAAATRHPHREWRVAEATETWSA